MYGARVNVGVIETWHDGTLPYVDNLRFWLNQRLDLLVGAHLDKLVARDGKRFRIRRCIVDRDDTGVQNNRVDRDYLGLLQRRRT